MKFASYWPRFMIVPLLMTSVFCLFAVLLVTGCKKSEASARDWFLFVPAESRHADCQIFEDVVDTPSKRTGIRLTSKEKARFGFRRDGPAIQVSAGERYHLSAWVRIADDASVEPGSPGVVLRATFFSNTGVAFSGGHVYIGTRGVTTRDAEKLFGAPLPHRWEKVAATIEIPSGVKEMKFYLFCWYTAGNVYFDEPRIEKHQSGTPITPVL